MITYILTPPLGANFFPKKSLHLEGPTSLCFGPSVKFCRFFFDGVPKAPILSFWPKVSLVTQSITKNGSSNVKLEKVFYFQNFFFFTSIEISTNSQKKVIL